MHGADPPVSEAGREEGVEHEEHESLGKECRNLVGERPTKSGPLRQMPKASSNIPWRWPPKHTE